MEITIKYRDEMSNGEWRTTKCVVPDVEEAKRIYGLDGSDPTLLEYVITEIDGVETPEGKAFHSSLKKGGEE